MDTTIIAALLTIVAMVISGGYSYQVSQRDKQRSNEINDVKIQITNAAALLLTDKDKLADRLLDESRRNTQLVLDEKDKAAKLVKEEFDRLNKELFDFRIKVAEHYATTTLVKEILEQFTTPMVKEFEEVKAMLDDKIGRREFDSHKDVERRDKTK
jgi:hypothetical protein